MSADGTIYEGKKGNGDAKVALTDAPTTPPEKIVHVGFYSRPYRNGLVTVGTVTATAFFGGVAGYGGYRLGCKMFGV